MKKGITCWSDHDRTGRWILVIEKKRGKLTLEDIREAATEWELDIYLLPLDCREDEGQCFGDEAEGDRVVLYRTDLLNEDRED